MKSEDSELLLKASLDELSPDESKRLEDLFARDPEAKGELERLRRIESLVAGAPQESFAPFFATRVMQRLDSERAGQTTSLADSLTRLFYRVAPAALVLAVALFAFGAVTRSDDSQSLLESALGLQAVTLDEAFSFDATYYAMDVDDTDVGGED